MPLSSQTLRAISATVPAAARDSGPPAGCWTVQHGTSPSGFRRLSAASRSCPRTHPGSWCRNGTRGRPRGCSGTVYSTASQYFSSGEFGISWPSLRYGSLGSGRLRYRLYTRHSRIAGCLRKIRFSVACHSKLISTPWLSPVSPLKVPRSHHGTPRRYIRIDLDVGPFHEERDTFSMQARCRTTRSSGRFRSS